MIPIIIPPKISNVIGFFSLIRKHLRFSYILFFQIYNFPPNFDNSWLSNARECAIKIGLITPPLIYLGLKERFSTSNLERKNNQFHDICLT